MFGLKRPCKTCPFRRGGLVGLHPERIKEILAADAFQCHGTVDYDNFEDPDLRQGRKPQQCAGWIVMTQREGVTPQIVQVAQRLLGFDPGAIIADEVFETAADCIAAHTGDPRP
jgi:hypothetical protein